MPTATARRAPAFRAIEPCTEQLAVKVTLQPDVLGQLIAQCAAASTLHDDLLTCLANGTDTSAFTRLVTDPRVRACLTVTVTADEANELTDEIPFPCDVRDRETGAWCTNVNCDGPHSFEATR